MKSKQAKVKEAQFVVSKDDLSDVENEFDDDDVVKIVDESNEDEVKDLHKKTKKESFKIKKSAINEMINDKLVNRVSIGDHSLKDNPSLPKLSGEDYLMKLVDLKYEDICKTIKTNYGVDSVDFTEILPDFYKNLKNISLFESGNEDELVKLAITIILEEFGLDFGDIMFDAEIIADVTEIPSDMELEYSPKNSEDIEMLQAEVHKRRILNAIIQGGARSLVDSLKMKKSEIADIDTRLYNSYVNVLPVGDLMYYSNDDEVEGIKTGSVSIVKNQDTPVIMARGVNFPMLLLQMAKGVLEILLSEEPSDRCDYIKSKADSSEFESDDVRLGLSIYDMICKKVDCRDSRVNYLTISTMSDVEVPEFHLMMKDILGNTTDGDKFIKQIKDSSIRSLKEYDDQENIHTSGYSDLSDVDEIDLGI